MKSTDQMLGARTGTTVRVVVQGRAVADQCPSLLKFVSDALLDGARQVRIDLQQCEYGDSTFVGTLLQLLRSTESTAPQGFALVAPSPMISQTLCTMGLQRLFQIQSADGRVECEGWQVLPADRSNRHSFEFCHQVVAAHQELADSSKSHGELYRSIADEAAKELRSRNCHS